MSPDPLRSQSPRLISPVRLSLTVDTMQLRPGSSPTLRISSKCKAGYRLNSSSVRQKPSLDTGSMSPC